MTLRALEEQSPQRLAHPDTSTIFVLGLLGLAFFPLGIAALGVVVGLGGFVVRGAQPSMRAPGPR